MINVSGETLISGGMLIGLAILIFRNNKHLEDKFVNKDVCKIVSKNFEKDIKDVKTKVDCIPKIKAGLDTLLIDRGLKKTDD